MAIEKPAPWVGASGTAYTFHVFGLDADVPSRPGTFIYAKRNAEGAWVPVLMGHGDLSSRCTDPDRLRCIKAKAATHLHLRLNSDDADRAAELEDLLAQYANAFAPEGCQPGPNAAVSTAASAGRSKPARPGKAAAKKAAPRKAAAKKAPAKKAPAKKTPTKKAPAKKAATKTAKVKAKAPRPRSR